MIRLSVVLLFFLTASAVAEEEDIVYEPDARPVVDAAEEQSGIELSELEDIEINTDHTVEDEDIFVPTDEVSYQQSVPFPTDI